MKKLFLFFLLLILILPVTVLAKKECKWVRGGGGSDCLDAGYPIIASLDTCVEAGLGDPSITDVCCCRENVTTPPLVEPVTADQSPPQAGGVVNYNYSTVTNPLQTVSVPTVAGRIVNAFLLIVGSIFLIIIIYGGFVWMTAAGNEAKVAKGRKTLSWGVMGIIVIFLAWMLVAFIFETLNV